MYISNGCHTSSLSLTENLIYQPHRTTKWNKGRKNNIFPLLSKVSIIISMFIHTHFISLILLTAKEKKYVHACMLFWILKFEILVFFRSNVIIHPSSFFRSFRITTCVVHVMDRVRFVSSRLE